MSMQYTSIKRTLLALMIAVCLSTATLYAQSSDIHENSTGSLRTLMMPGPLVGSHKKYENQCEKCHGENAVRQRQLCLDCHETIATDVTLSLHFHGRHPLIAERDCSDCHSEHLGENADISRLDQDRFDHNLTEFALEGEHANLECDNCHKADTPFRETQHQCIACHKSTDFHQGKLGDACQDCHQSRGWSETDFDHDKTSFPLKAAHSDLECQSCHVNQQWRDLPADCVNCHAGNDIHAGNAGEACQDCHSKQKWSSTRFDHNKDTHFTLDGGHNDLTCSQCHLEGGVQRPIPARCSACHLDNDIHAGSLGTQCADCHSTDAWSKGTFDHEKHTQFPLRGAHKELSCPSCHLVQRDNIDVYAQCVDCHQQDDPHRGSLPGECQQCHNEKSWQDNVSFNHDFTQFPLVGLHAVTACDSCHIGGDISNTDSQCVTCHAIDNPHRDIYSEDCTACHTAKQWLGVHFDHATTSFALEGKHQDLTCTDCHQDNSGPAERLASDCYSCHKQDDVHQRRFGNDCQRCHSTETFQTLEIKR